MLGMEMDEKNKRVIRYIISKLSDDKTGGRTKLMKLMFLIEHYDIEKESIKLVPEIGNDFIIYNYGVFSFSIYNSLISLIRSGEVKEDGFRLYLNNSKKVENIKDAKLNKQINNILNKFGGNSKKQLEEFTLKLLGIPITKKIEFMGIPVKNIIMSLS